MIILIIDLLNLIQFIVALTLFDERGPRKIPGNGI